MGALFSAPTDDEWLAADHEPKRMVIFIEGNISAGKSTLINSLKEKKYVVEEEAVNVWTSQYVNSEKQNILELFYQDKKSNAFEMQLASLVTKWKAIRRVFESDEPVILVERSLLTDINSFALLMNQQNLLTDIKWSLYCDLHAEFEVQMKEWMEDIDIHYLYLRTEPEVCFDRVHVRQRSEESNISLDYLQSLHECLDEWLLCNPTSCIDGSQSKEKVLDDVLSYVKEHSRERR